MLLSTAIFSQTAKITTDKEKYKFDEIIEVTFDLNAKYDSIDLPDFEGFQVISGPNKSSSVSIQNGEKTVSESTTYRLRPLESGWLKINSPAYFIDGKKIRGKSAKIQVDPSNLTPAELREKEIQEFIEYGIKPKGTTKIILHENKAYMEIFGELGWEFHRRLTPEEIEQIIKMK